MISFRNPASLAPAPVGLLPNPLLHITGEKDYSGNTLTEFIVMDMALSPEAPENMKKSVQEATSFLKAIAHEGRLMILCHLGTGERSVGELETLLELRQAAVSQMLARLREDGLVQPRREGKTVYYSLKGPETRATITLLHQLYCEQ